MTLDKTIILYSTGCPKCTILKRELDKYSVNYTTKSDVDEMISLGISSAPALSVDGKIMNFNDAVRWVREEWKTLCWKQMVE